MPRRRLPTFFRGDEPERLVAAASPGRDRLILLVGLLCGLRVSEITKLHVPDLDLSQRSLRVNQGKGGKDRVVPIPAKLVDPLRAWLGDRVSGPVFPSPRGGGPLSTRAVQRLMKRLAQKANLPGATEPRKVTPHKMRHHYATRLIQTGADIMEVRDLLGHSSVSTTQIYLHTSPERLRGAVDRL
jgi:integrase/recombinase XerD